MLKSKLWLFDLGNFTMDISFVQNLPQNQLIRCTQHVLVGNDSQSSGNGRGMVIPQRWNQTAEWNQYTLSIHPTQLSSHNQRSKQTSIFSLFYYVNIMNSKTQGLQKDWETSNSKAVIQCKSFQFWRYNNNDTVKKWFTYLFKHSLSSWFFKQLRGSSWLQ